MRNKVAKQLRKHAEFVPSAPRTYNNVEVIRKGYIRQYNSMTCTTSLVLRDVVKTIVECTQLERILYKTFKKRYTTNTNEELVLNQLPTKEILNDITKQIINQKTV
ncbi:hypothetical protein M0R04_11615 [Candidatus Dojkabacteria bacterium]|jgi:hypothetical protein|nr:hypothetical protein [Candidatus Dojkabacteria bacterium]